MAAALRYCRNSFSEMKKIRVLTIFGGGWSARLAALAAAQQGADVRLIEPYLDADGLPRPFPSSANPKWVQLLSKIGLDIAWDDFGGAVANALTSRLISNSRHDLTIGVAGGTFSIRQTDPLWAWSEPRRGYAFLVERLNVLLDSYRIERRTATSLSLRRSVRKGLTFCDQLLDGAKLLAFLPDSNWRVFNFSANQSMFPRSGMENAGRWWCSANRRTCYVSGDLHRLWPRFQTVPVEIANTQQSGVWGLVSSSQLKLVRIASPAHVAPSEWFLGVYDAAGNA